MTHLYDKLIEWQTHWMTNSLNDKPIEWQVHWMTNSEHLKSAEDLRLGPIMSSFIQEVIIEQKLK